MRLIWLAFLILSSASLQAKEPEIQIRALSLIRDQANTITLGDLANFQHLLVRDQKQLSQIPIGNAPEEGENREFTSFAISEILRRPLSQLEERYTSKIKLSIPRVVRIERASAPLSRARAQMEIQKHYQNLCDQCEIIVSQVQITSKDPVRNWTIAYKSDLPKGSFSLPVQHGAKAQTAWVSGKIQIFRRLAVSTRTLNAGEKIAATDISEQRREITFAPDNVPTAEELRGASVARTVLANQVIWKNSLARMKALNRGDLVKLISGASSWQISTTGIAQQAGYIGDVVRVLNPQSQHTVSGVVVGRETVRIQ